MTMDVWNAKLLSNFPQSSHTGRTVQVFMWYTQKCESKGSQYSIKEYFSKLKSFGVKKGCLGKTEGFKVLEVLKYL